VTLRISQSLRHNIIERAGNRCEFCLLPAGVSFFPHEIDHLIAQKHGGRTQLDNLAYACWRCNRHKGTDLGSFDPDTMNLPCCSILAFMSGPNILGLMGSG
jgi:hypothetical protein